MRVYHFSPSRFALSDVQRRHIKIARLAELNDPFEHLSVSLEDDELHRAMIATKTQLSERFGFLCFCREWSNPIMWSHYADSHRSICLGFDFDRELSPIVYAEQRFIIPRELYADKFLLNEADMLRIMGTKFRGWEYEQELRVIASLNDEEDGLYFADFSDEFRLREIIVGVRCSTPLAEIQTLVASYPEPVKVIQATLARGKFEIVAAR